ncbi:MAG: glycoside hydrolase family 36 protein [Candidatus Sericytochromatia bacterium]|nr:glycoside hydrolase family 36 protein [Candidatus Sericytochromatia bacterium]
MGAAEVRGGGLVARPEPGRLALHGTDGTSVLGQATARVGLADGTTWPLQAGRWRRVGAGARWVGGNAASIRRPGGELRLAWAIAPHPEGLVLTLTLTNRGPTPLGVAWLAPLEAPWPGSWGADRLRVTQTGYQSWSPATPPLPLTRQRPLPEPPIAGPPGIPEAGFASPWVCALEPAGAEPLTLGFLEAERWPGLIRLTPTWAGGRLAAVWLTDGLILAPGARVCTAPLLVLAGGAEALSRYAAAVADRPGAAPSGRRAQAGWCSWYTRFASVTEADVLRNAAALRQHAATREVTLVQLDDGWQGELGDWLEVNGRFPRGLRALAQDLRAQGLLPGLWLAPFVVGSRSRLATAHPDWLLQGPDGAPVLALHNWDQRCHALDLAVPAARTHLAQVVRTAVEAWGFGFLKLDFLYAGALAGRRAGGLPALAAYRLGLAAIREAAGDAFLLGCGAPLLPSVGLVDAMRVGPDVAAAWHPADGDASSPALANALRSTLARGWMHGKWWQNDPDCLLLGPEHRGITLAERLTWAATVLLSGGAKLLSDEIATLSPTAQGLLPTLLGHAAGPATILATDLDGLATRAWQSVPAWGAQAGIAALLNPAGHTATAPAAAQDWPGPATPWVMDLGDQHPVWRAWKTPLKLPLAPHGVRLLLVTPEPLARPLPWVSGAAMSP